MECDYCGYTTGIIHECGGIRYENRNAMICDECMYLLKTNTNALRSRRKPQLCVGDIKLSPESGAKRTGSIDQQDPEDPQGVVGKSPEEDIYQLKLF